MAGEGKVKNFWETFLESFGFSPAVDELSFNNPQDLEAALRRRAFVCRRQSGIFLLAILLMICVAFYVTWGFLRHLDTTRELLLVDFKKDFNTRLNNAEEETKRHFTFVEDNKMELRRFLTGLGVKWDRILFDKSTTPQLNSINSLPSDILIADEATRDGLQIWYSENKSKSWVQGAHIQDKNFPNYNLKIINNRLIVLASERSWSIYDNFTLYVSDNLGRSFNAINLPAFEDFSCGNGGPKRPWRKPIITQNYVLEIKECRDLSKTKLRVISLKNGTAHYITAPEDMGYIRIVKEGNEKTINILAKNKSATYHHTLWSLDMREKKFSKPLTTPLTGSLIAAAGNRFIAISSDLKKKRLKALIWDADNKITKTIFLKRPDIEVKDWMKGLEIIASKNRIERDIRSKLRLNIKTKKITNNTVFIYFISSGKFFDITLVTQTKGVIDKSVHILKGTPFSKRAAPYIITNNDKKQREIKLIDLKTGKVLSKVSPPKNLFGFEIANKKNEWQLVSDGDLMFNEPMSIWTRREGEADWIGHTIPKHLQLEVKLKFLKDLIILKAFNASDRSETKGLFRSIPYTPPNVFNDITKLLQYVKTDAPRTIEQWQKYSAFKERLERLRELEVTKVYLNERLKKLSGISEKKSKKATSFGQEGISLNLILLLISRFLIIGIIFFAVRILINLYRYFLRLASFYEGRADGLALMLANDDIVKLYLPKDLSLIFKAVSPDDHDLAATPKTPVNEVLSSANEITRAAADIVKKAKG